MNADADRLLFLDEGAEEAPSTPAASDPDKEEETLFIVGLTCCRSEEGWMHWLVRSW